MITNTTLLDLIAIPDFEAGAMENWGLITYRMTAILYNPKIASVANKQRVAVVIAHELAHQVSYHSIEMLYHLHHVYSLCYHYIQFTALFFSLFVSVYIYNCCSSF